MRFISSLAIISLAGFGLARHPPKCRNDTPCMSSADVQELANAWARMFTAWQDSDAEYLANDYAARARGLNRAQGRPFDGISVDKAQFIRTASSRVLGARVTVTDVLPASCDKFVLIWDAYFRSYHLPTRCIYKIGTSYDKGVCHWQIKSMEFECDWLTYLDSFGGSWSPPPPPPPPPRR